MRTFIIGGVLVLAGIAAAYATLLNDDVDKCLDSGGRWDAVTKSCVG